MDETESILKSIQRQAIRNKHLRKIKQELIEEVSKSLAENPLEIQNNDPPALPKNHVQFDKVWQNIYIHYKTQV